MKFYRFINAAWTYMYIVLSVAAKHLKLCEIYKHWCSFLHFKNVPVNAA